MGIFRPRSEPIGRNQIRIVITDDSALVTTNLLDTADELRAAGFEQVAERAVVLQDGSQEVQWDFMGHADQVVIGRDEQQEGPADAQG